MKKYIITIGANNTTKQVEKNKIENILEIHKVDGASIIDTVGYWQGEKEPSVRVEILPTREEQGDDYFTRLCLDLRDRLDQQAVMLESLESNTQFI